MTPRKEERMAERYTALCRRSGGWWAVEVPEVPGVFTQARRLDHVPQMAADAIALMLDLDPGEVVVEVVPTIDATADALVEEALTTRQVAAQAADAASLAASRAARVLHCDRKLPLRDVGTIMGLSHQRVHQLIPTTD
jgi:predicted RNase H-like HicB family nuclease